MSLGNFKFFIQKSKWIGKCFGSTWFSNPNQCGCTGCCRSGWARFQLRYI